MTDLPIRFGVAPVGPTTAAGWRETAIRAEALGYSTLVVPDLVGPALSPLVALAVAAGATRALRLGTYVLAASTRNPLVLAHEAATLDLLSGGRFELGVGAGRADHDYAGLGIAPEPAGARIDRLAGTLHTIDQLLRGGGARLPATVQRPRPPILVAGGGRRILALAAQVADIVTIGAGPDEQTFATRRRWVEQAADDRFDDLELNVTLHAASTLVNPMLAGLAGVDAATAIAAGSLYALMGSPDQMRDQLLRRRERYGVSYYTLVGLPMDVLAPVIERLAGG